MRKLVTMAMVLVCATLPVMAQFSGTGSGTEADPYLIRNVVQLSQMANFNGQDGVVFKLQKDLDLSDWIADENPRQGWAPVGVSSEPFKGTLIGNDKKITGLTITRTSESNVGFFGCLDGATISDLTIEGTNVTGSSYLGTLAGKVSNSTITNCRVVLSGQITSASGEYVGGFIGNAANSTFSNCCVETVVTSTGAKYVGGFGGGATDGTTISGGMANVTVNSTEECTGGLLGYTKTVTINDTKVAGDITGTSCVAGFIAKAEGTDNITNAIYIGDLYGETYIGGISAYLASGSTSSFVSCSTKGKITATGDYVGGVVGYSQGACIAEMEKCSHYGDIHAGSYVGGIIGCIDAYNQDGPVLNYYYLQGSSTYYTNPRSSDLYSIGSVSDTIIEGDNDNYFVNNCLAIGNIKGYSFIGGIIGKNYSSRKYVSKSKTQVFKYSSGYPSVNYYYKYLYKSIDGGNLTYVNGNSGGNPYTVYYIEYSSVPVNTIIANCSYTGNIDGVTNVGGIVGCKSGGLVLSNYTSGNINGEENIGGIIGLIPSGKSNIYYHGYINTSLESNVANNNLINASTSGAGRIYGNIDSQYSIIGELGSSKGNRALSKAQVFINNVNQELEDNLQNGTSAGPSSLKTKANYQAWGWNFDNDWSILDGESYPYKKYQAAPPSIESSLCSQATSISGTSINGGTVYLSYKGQEPIAIECTGEDWSIEMEPLQSGASVEIYTEAEGLAPSYPVKAIVIPAGSGTESDPYQLYTAYDLQAISKRGYYKVMNDIDVTSWITENSPTEGWKPIGTDGIESVNIDGNHHKIKGLWSNTSASSNGLFGNMSSGGQVKDLSIEVAAGKKLQGGAFGGVLAGYTIGVSVENCLVSGNVETERYAGGLIGYAIEGEITKCYTKGSVKATGEGGYAGGLTAYCSTPITNCYSTATVEASECAAGLVGYSSSTIDKCYAQGSVSGLKYGAGIVALLDGAAAAVTNSVALNESITMPAQYASASRVLNGNINGCPDPDESNLALKTMVVTVNGKVEKKYDDEWEGTGKSLDELKLASTYEALGWNFTTTWGIVENETSPYLLAEIKQGDVNRDGQIDMTDAISILYHYFGQTPKVFLTETADMNGDGNIDLTDAIIIVYMYLGADVSMSAARQILLGNEIIPQ